MATIKTTDSRTVVDSLGLQLINVLKFGTSIGSTLSNISSDLATGGAVPTQDQTVKYALTDTKMTETINEQSDSFTSSATYTLTGSNLKSQATAQASKLGVTGTVEYDFSNNGFTSILTFKSTGSVALTGNPHNTDDVTVTQAAYTTQQISDYGDQGKSNQTNTVSFRGEEQYGVDGDGNTMQQSILIKNFTNASKLSSNSSIITSNAQENIAFSSTSGLSYNNSTGSISGALDKLTYTAKTTSSNEFVTPQANSSYTSGAFTSNMLDALAEAAFAGGDFANSFAARKAAIFGGDDTITGDAKKANYIEAGVGNDSVTGGAAADTLYGDEGNDKLFGLGGNDVLFGGDGDDVLDGGAGVDVMVGGNGNDTYILDNELDLDRVNFDGLMGYTDDGIDTLRISYNGGSVAAPSMINMFLNSEVENVTIASMGVFSVIGNDSDNVLDAGKTASTLSGYAGDDTYYVRVKGVTVIEDDANGADGNDTVISALTYALGDNLENLTLTGKAARNGTGNELDNTLIGNDGANILDGGSGADSLAGGNGNDTYIVDNTGDIVTEALNAGTDTVRSSVSYTLGANLENLTLFGSTPAGIWGTGNELKNIITGNAGNNLLDGAGGVDKLAGGDGQDTYIVDLIAKGVGAKATAALEDTVIENKGEGDSDTLYLRVSQDTQNKLATASKATMLTLGANIEDLDASDTGSVKLNLTGNTANNSLIGNDTDNVLNGGAGNDLLYGGDGDDLIIGGLGTDILNGGNGNDTFSFTSLKDLGLDATQDVIQDFTSGEDVISLKGFKGWTFDTSATAAAGTKQLWAVADGGDMIVYGNSGGTLDADFSIKLVGVTVLASADVVFA
ncbi:MAG: hypothetical protein VCA57_13330 [Pseudomonas sp.]|uniref:hypothetical protein n=1 Tax=Pseudomonas sp. TaxID=306 RepID=UPI003982D025